MYNDPEVDRIWNFQRYIYIILHYIYIYIREMGMCSPFNTLFFGGAGLCVTRQNPSNANPIRKAS